MPIWKPTMFSGRAVDQQGGVLSDHDSEMKGWALQQWVIVDGHNDHFGRRVRRHIVVIATISNDELIRSLGEHGKEDKAAFDNRVALRGEILRSRCILVFNGEKASFYGRFTGALDDETSLEGRLSQLYFPLSNRNSPLDERRADSHLMHSLALRDVINIKGITANRHFGRLNDRLGLKGIFTNQTKQIFASELSQNTTARVLSLA